ncbi:MAG TPA: hypothetical protein VMB79_12555, partial [Jatrophihabitans sp.]|nr:hypothetical protein [Jatrophihabitans sp.]
PSWHRRREASERHIRSVLSTPAARFRDQDPAHGVLLGYFESARLYAVATQVGEDSHVSLSTVIMSAFSRALTTLCTDFPIRVGLVASNRFGERWGGLVTSMNQMISIPVEPGGECLRQPALQALQAQTLRAYRLAMHDYDAVRPARLGLPDDTDPAPTYLYNIAPAWSSQPSPVQDGDVPTISWRSAFNTLGPQCMLRVGETPNGTLIVYLRIMGVSEADGTRLLQSTYSLVMQAGAHVLSET